MAVLRVFSLDGETIDRGLALWFQAPDSFTGEEVVELHCHGNPVILGALIEELCRLGARLARPGEFSERAFMNERMDLAQAEALADLITARSLGAARGAAQSLEGVFSRRVAGIDAELIRIRTQIEAGLNYDDTELDGQQQQVLQEELRGILDKLKDLTRDAKSGKNLFQGAQLAIVGAPNVGKSSLINQLAQHDLAIISQVPGTTRDLVRASLVIEDIPVEVIDTAGLRTDPADDVEREGMVRTVKALEQAGLILHLVDASAEARCPMSKEAETLLKERANQVLTIHNKCDLLEPVPEDGFYISALVGTGLDELRHELARRLKQHLEIDDGTAGFSARERHLLELENAAGFLQQGVQRLEEGAADLLAQDLRDAHEVLGKITGKFSTEDLLLEIFSSFCLGK